jgi:hypothetical protein
MATGAKRLTFLKSCLNQLQAAAIQVQTLSESVKSQETSRCLGKPNQEIETSIADMVKVLATSETSFHDLMFVESVLRVAMNGLKQVVLLTKQQNFSAGGNQH